MININDHKTGHLWDPWEHLGGKRRKLLDESWAGVFREHILHSVHGCPLSILDGVVKKSDLLRRSDFYLAIPRLLTNASKLILSLNLPLIVFRLRFFRSDYLLRQF